MLFKDDVAIVLGAGASVDFGLPLGRTLWSMVSTEVKCFAETFRERGATTFGDFNTITHHHISQERRCIGDALRGVAGDTALVALYQASEVITSANVHSSVDDFVRDHPSLSAPIQAAVAASIFSALYEPEDGGGRYWNLKERLSAGTLIHTIDREGRETVVRNWVRQFVGLVRPASARVETVTPISIVSFNYDRLFETLVRKFWPLAEVTYPSVDECFRFIYPYGAFTGLPDTVQDVERFLNQQRAALSFMGTSELGEEVASMISNSTRVLFVGFSFAQTNMDILGVAPERGHMYHVQNYRGEDKRLDRVLIDRLGVPTKNVDQASMEGLVQNGFFELMS
ncbi:MAG: hypothetical protein IV086_10380 [Hyphomonadaceae bacterium]|nr:hypothetical protein [Hyphomonadaceae bacterium]